LKKLKKRRELLAFERYRNEFPLLKHWIYLNTADMMIPGKYWMDAVRECLNFYECGRIEDMPVADIATHPFLTPVFSECIRRASKLIHAKESEVTNMYRIMTATNLVVNNLLEWERGDNIVFTDLTYPSMSFIFKNLSERKKVELRRIKQVNGEILLSDFEKNVDDKSKLVCICRTTPFCGFTHDVKEICRIAHEHGALVYDDAFQAVGVIDVDVKKDDVDFLVTGSYKWQCGPEGAGIFYIKEELRDTLDPSYWNYHWIELPGPAPFGQKGHDNIESWEHPPQKTANRLGQEVCVTPILFGWNATLKFLEKLGIQNVEKRVKELGGYCIERLQDIGCKVLTPTDPEKRHGLIMYTNGNWEKDVETFNRIHLSPSPREKPIKVSVRSLGGIEGIRVSPHFFNTEEDIDLLIEAQKKIHT
jgi:selenocysteine lyase/cysteine desulfurase